MYQIVALHEHEQINASATGVNSIVGETSPPDHANTKHKSEENSKPLPLSDLNVSAIDESLTTPSIGDEFHIESGSEVVPCVEHQFIPNFSCKSLLHQSERTDAKSLSPLRDDECEGDVSVSLQLGEREPKKRKRSDPLS